MRTNDNGPVVTIQQATRLMVIAAHGYIVMLLPSPFHSPHVLQSKNKERVIVCRTRSLSEDIQMRHAEIRIVRCNVHPLSDMLFQ